MKSAIITKKLINSFKLNVGELLKILYLREEENDLQNMYIFDEKLHFLWKFNLIALVFQTECERYLPITYYI